MNTYKIIAESTRTGQWLAEMWDAESEKEARERFLAVHKGRYTITSSELVYTDVPERGAREQAGRERRSETLLTYVCDEVCRHRVPGRSQEELDDICAACSLETLAEGVSGQGPGSFLEQQRRLHDAPLLRRAEAAEAEVLRLKAKLYDLMTANT